MDVLQIFILCVCSLLLCLAAADAAEVSFAKDIIPLLVNPIPGNIRSCAGCHKPKGPSSYQITLGDPQTVDYGSLFKKGDKEIIVKGKAQESLFCTKLRAVLPETAKGVRMPHNGPAYLSDTDIQKICDWVSEGAKNN